MQLRVGLIARGKHCTYYEPVEQTNTSEFGAIERPLAIGCRIYLATLFTLVLSLSTSR